MAFFEWNESYSINNKRIDQQHQKLVQLIQDLFNAIADLNGNEKVESTLVALFDYTVSHFSMEETLMRQYEFPGIKYHLHQHKEFIEKVKEFQSEFSNGNNKLSVQILNFLKDWLINHIQKTDHELGVYLASKGVAQA